MFVPRKIDPESLRNIIVQPNRREITSNRAVLGPDQRVDVGIGSCCENSILKGFIDGLLLGSDVWIHGKRDGGAREFLHTGILRDCQHVDCLQDVVRTQVGEVSLLGSGYQNRVGRLESTRLFELGKARKEEQFVP